MKYYSKYTFKQNPKSPSCYLLEEIEGEEVHGMMLAVYKRTEYAGRKYMIMREPRRPSMKKFFAYTFEMFSGIPITSTEKINELHRTFGDAKKFGTYDLILFQFSDNLENLDVYFLKDGAKTISDKKRNFLKWNCGEKLELVA